LCGVLLANPLSESPTFHSKVVATIPAKSKALSFISRYYFPSIKIFNAFQQAYWASPSDGVSVIGRPSSTTSAAEAWMPRPVWEWGSLKLILEENVEVSNVRLDEFYGDRHERPGADEPL
jgi:hypothetical protein